MTVQWNTLKAQINYLSAADIRKIEMAFEMGKDLHKDQLRKSGEPYFTHPIAVTKLLANMHADADTLIAALLHDSVEDTPITLEVLDSKFDGAVAQLIDGVTKLEPEEFAEKPTMDNQIETLRKMFTSMEKDVRIMVIKLMDRLHNMQTIAHLAPERQITLAQETLEVYVKIADRLCMWDLRDEMESLCMVILEPETHAQLSELLVTREKEGKRIVDKMKKELERDQSDTIRNVDIHYERKAWKKLRTQWETDGAPVTGVSAYTAIFVCKDVADCYHTLGVIHQQWRRETLSFQDFINAPMINGYEALHTTAILENGTRVRCKIRTKEMQDYARNGIALYCFDSKAQGLLDYVTWARRIRPLSEDTEKRSEHFWESLKSDILGDSIVIHGLGDQTVQIPKDATALDGAFYVYSDLALSTQLIKVNGIEVPFQKKLSHGDSVSIVCGSKPQAERDWLDSVHTGLAAATIRSALAQRSSKSKTATGKEIFQDVMTEHNSGFIEEFDEQTWAQKIEKLGFANMTDAYIALSDGHLLANELYETIFGKSSSKKTQQKKVMFLVKFTIDAENMDLIEKLIQLHKKHDLSLKNFRFRLHEILNGYVTMKQLLTDTEAQSLQKELISIGATNVSIKPVQIYLKYIVQFGALFFLWGMDPVIANHLLRTTVSAEGLTLLRILIFFIMTGLLYAAQMNFSRHKYKKITLLQPSLLMTGTALVLTALMSYKALTLISPVEYILMVVAGVSLVSIAHDLQKKASSLRNVIMFSLIAATLVLLIQLRETSMMGLLFGMAGSLGFAIYSEISTRYQKEEALIQARYPAYLFFVSVIGLPFVAILWPFSNISALPPMVIMTIVGFVFTFNILPYAIYYELTKQMHTSSLQKMLVLVIVFTMLGEAAFSKNFAGFFAAPILLIFILQYLMQANSESSL